jgi:spore coat protein U-like protein
MKRSSIARTVAVTVALGAVVIGVMAARLTAATATANLMVSASVANNCTINTAALAFGSYDPVVANSTANLDGTGGVSVACTKGATATIALGTGGNASGSTRRMADGSGNFLAYELYQDSGRSVIWSTSGAGLLTPAAAPSKAARDFTVFGRIGGNQDVPAGTYGDTIVATVNF